MKGIRKRILTVLLTAVMVCGLASVGTLADVDWPSLFFLRAHAENYSGSCGGVFGEREKVTWSLDTETGVMTISGTGDMMNCAIYSAVPWYSRRAYIRFVTIENGVTNIGNYAFHDCTNLESVSIPEGVTRIGNFAFYNCKALADVTIVSGVTEIGRFAFNNCQSLTDVTIPDSVTIINGSAFYGCKNLVRVSIGSGVTTIGQDAFMLCWKLADVTVKGSLTSVGGGAFSGIAFCSNEDNWTGDELYLGHALIGFRNEEVTDYTVKDGTTCIAGGVFAACYNLQSVTIPDGVMSIGGGAFDECAHLTTVSVPDSVTSIGDYAFNYCCSLVNFTMPENLTWIGSSAFHYCHQIAGITIPSGVQYIGSEAFYHCTQITEITIPESVEKIDDCAFMYCTNLTRVEFNAANCRYMGWDSDTVFKGCAALETVTIGNAVTTIPDYAFSRCSSLKQVEFGDHVQSIGAYAFANCESIERVVFPDSVTDLGEEVFCICPSLQEIYIPASVCLINDYNSFARATVFCVEDSYAHRFAEEHGLDVRFVSASVDLENAVLRTEIPFQSGTEVYETRLADDALEVAGLASPPDVTTYRIGEKLNTSGLALELRSDSRSTIVLKSGFSVSRPVFSHSGEQAVTVNCGGQTVGFTVTVTDAIVSGDVDGSGTHTLRDTATILRYLAGGWDVDLDEADADVNKDGTVDLKDATLLRRYLVGGWGVALR